jgi:hypothetical protein
MAARSDISAAQSATLMNPQLSARRTDRLDPHPEPDPLSTLSVISFEPSILGTI